MTNPSRLSLDRIARAATLIDPVFLNSPQFRMEPLDAPLGCRLVVKVETLNPIRSFKGRGAEFFVASVDGLPHLTCTTAGNFGQGMAFAARKRGIPLTIFTSRTANPLKIERMRALGAEVRLVEDFDTANQAADRFAADTGALRVTDGRDPAISEGAGTIGIEMLRWPESFDAILVPVGDGALLAGMARWVKTHAPSTRMIGVCARGAPAMERSWRAGRALATERTDTIADGIAVRMPFPEPLADLLSLADDFLLVEEEALVSAMRLAQQQLGVVLEPAGAAGLAAVVAHRERFNGQLVGTVLTGGNVTLQQTQQWLSE